MLNWKGPRTQLPSSKLVKSFLKIIALAHTYQLAKFGGLMSDGSNDVFKNTPCLVYNTDHDVTDLVNHRMVKNTKIWVSWERNIAFLRNKKIRNLYLIWHILRNYNFVAEVMFKLRKVMSITISNKWEQLASVIF